VSMLMTTLLSLWTLLLVLALTIVVTGLRTSQRRVKVLEHRLATQRRLTKMNDRDLSEGLRRHAKAVETSRRLYSQIDNLKQRILELEGENARLEADNQRERMRHDDHFSR